MGKRKHGGGDGEGGAKKKHGYFSTNANAGLPTNSRGFLISCLGGKEPQAAREAANVLTEFYEKLSPGKGETDGAEVNAATDIAAAIADEVAELKDKGNRLFVYHKTNINGLAYLSMKADAEGPGPVQLASALAQEVKDTRQCRTRLCIRFLPVEKVCRADVEEIGRTAKELTDAHFPTGEGAATVRFAVAYEHRASKDLDRMEVINSVVNQIPQPPHKVDLTNADKTILVQLLKANAALSVVSNYKQLSKFNVRELSTSDDEQQKAVRAAAAAKKEAADVAAPAGAAEQPLAQAQDAGAAKEHPAVQPADKDKKEGGKEQDGSVQGHVGAGIAMVADDEDSDAAAP
ncbi:g6660 [Coccomyxa elongata]